MGGLLSFLEPDPPPRRRTYVVPPSPTYTYARPEPPSTIYLSTRPTPPSSVNITSPITVYRPERKIVPEKPLSSVSQAQTTRRPVKQIEYLKLSFLNLNSEAGQRKVDFTKLSGFDYEEIASMFYRTRKKMENSITTIEKIIRVDNDLLKAAFDIQKKTMFRLYGVWPKENLYFHGTNQSNIRNICTYGFDWRKSGSNYGHKFGKGISFAPKSGYASHYGDVKKKNRVMLVVKVLECNRIVGNKQMIIPPNGYDTSYKPNGDVVVKYQDNECYPEYIIYYSEEVIQNNYYYDE